MKMIAAKTLQNSPMNYDEVFNAISESSMESKIYVGSDSKQFSKKGVDWVAYVCVVIIHKDAKHGGRIFSEYRIERDYGNLKQRLMQEVGMAIEVFTEIRENFGGRLHEIHLDINPLESAASSVCAKEATGYVMGCLGILPKLKPEAFAASAAADKIAVFEAGKRRNRNRKFKNKAA